jgi:hypothetical protein
VALPAANVVVQVLSGVGSPSGSGACDAVQVVTLVVLGCACGFVAWARPHRALLSSYLVCVSLVLTMVTVLLGLLCRHGALAEDAVSGFGVFVSVVMFVSKVYHVVMQVVERRLMMHVAEKRGDVSDPNEGHAPPASEGLLQLSLSSSGTSAQHRQRPRGWAQSDGGPLDLMSSSITRSNDRSEESGAVYDSDVGLDARLRELLEMAIDARAAASHGRNLL